MTENRSEALASRILDGLTVGSEMLTLDLGRRLGLFRISACPFSGWSCD